MTVLACLSDTWAFPEMTLLKLENNRIGGTLPAAWGKNFPKLIEFTLSNNSIHGGSCTWHFLQHESALLCRWVAAPAAPRHQHLINQAKRHLPAGTIPATGWLRGESCDNLGNLCDEADRTYWPELTNLCAQLHANALAVASCPNLHHTQLIYLPGGLIVQEAKAGQRGDMRRDPARPSLLPGWPA